MFFFVFYFFYFFQQARSVVAQEEFESAVRVDKPLSPRRNKSYRKTNLRETQSRTLSISDKKYRICWPGSGFPNLFSFLVVTCQVAELRPAKELFLYSSSSFRYLPGPVMKVLDPSFLLLLFSAEGFKTKKI